MFFIVISDTKSSCVRVQMILDWIVAGFSESRQSSSQIFEDASYLGVFVYAVDELSMHLLGRVAVISYLQMTQHFQTTSSQSSNTEASASQFFLAAPKSRRWMILYATKTSSRRVSLSSLSPNRRGPLHRRHAGSWKPDAVWLKRYPVMETTQKTVANFPPD